MQWEEFHIAEDVLFSHLAAKKKKNKGMMDIGWSCSYSHSTLQWR